MQLNVRRRVLKFHRDKNAEEVNVQYLRAILFINQNSRLMSQTMCNMPDFNNIGVKYCLNTFPIFDNFFRGSFILGRYQLTCDCCILKSY